MGSSIMNSIGTIAAALIVAAMIALAAATLIKDKKKGKSCCGSNCAHCAMACSCHKTK